MTLSPTLIWCFLMPSIHLFSLLSNILCIIVFCSKTFIKKPIAIYFIFLLISDSITLLIGYIEMIDRESNMIDKSSWLCMFNEKIIHRLVDGVYGFMERFCLEWMLYKVLWTRVSTILLAVLSVQRSRTFFSLAYRETRLCAFAACASSVAVAITITCLEWIGVQCGKSENFQVYLDIFQLVLQQKSSKEFYSNVLSPHSNSSLDDYPCVNLSLNEASLPSALTQLNCTSDRIASEFYSLTQSLIFHHDSHIGENATHLLKYAVASQASPANTSFVREFRQFNPSSDLILKLFDRRICQITLSFALRWKTFHFIHAVSFSKNRHSIAIFLGNALPSFVVLLANLLSIKVIYFSKSLQYLKKANSQTRRKSRLKHDLRAFTVILIESCSIIMISWGIPIFLTMYHCHTLYVESIAVCPRIKDYLALFLCTDLFNSSTNSLLYSLSGKLFRMKYLSIIQLILTCGRGVLWHTKRHSSMLANQRLTRQPSNNPSASLSTNHHHSVRSTRPSQYRYSERLPSPMNQKTTKGVLPSRPAADPYRPSNGYNRCLNDEISCSMGRTSDDQHSGKRSSYEIDSDIQCSPVPRDSTARRSSQAIKSFLISKVRSFSSTNATNSSKATPVQRSSVTLLSDRTHYKPEKTPPYSKRRTTVDFSQSTSSFSGSLGYNSPLKHPFTKRYLTKIVSDSTVDQLSNSRDMFEENLTSL